MKSPPYHIINSLNLRYGDLVRGGGLNFCILVVRECQFSSSPLTSFYPWIFNKYLIFFLQFTRCKDDKLSNNIAFVLMDIQPKITS